MLTLTRIGKRHGGRKLFWDVSLQFNPGCRYGIVGANGSGKSTLLRIAAGEEEASEGTVTVPRKARVGVLRQDHFQYEDTPILDVVMMGHAPLWEALQAKDRMLEQPAESFDAARYSELEEFVQDNDGYALESKAAEILAGLNIPDAQHRLPLSVLSGGFKLRALLAQVLAGEPNLLLLDEPTNHLDILSIRWLEKFLVAFEGCVLVVSHDHRFLNNVCTHIVDLDYERATLYPGDYTEFMAAKTGERERKEAEIAKREKEIADHQTFVERFRAKPTKARQARSKVKQIERIVIEELPQSSRCYPKFDLKARRQSGRHVVQIEGLCKGFNGRTVLEDVTLRVQRHDRLAIIGPNGIGKSTLLKIMVGRLAPDRGSVTWGYESEPGYFAQDHRELIEGQRATLQSWLWDCCPGESVGFVRGRLAQMLFKKDEVDKQLRNLSGGEAARLIFARLGVLQPTALVLDEPTNHLDLEGIEALADGLEGYDGTIIFVSHDRWLVSRLATRVLEIRPDGLQDFPGTYEEYLARCGDDHLDVEAVVRKARREKHLMERMSEA